MKKILLTVGFLALPTIAFSATDPWQMERDAIQTYKPVGSTYTDKQLLDAARGNGKKLAEDGDDETFVKMLIGLAEAGGLVDDSDDEAEGTGGGGGGSAPGVEPPASGRDKRGWKARMFSMTGNSGKLEHARLVPSVDRNLDNRLATLEAEEKGAIATATAAHRASESAASKDAAAERMAELQGMLNGRDEALKDLGSFVIPAGQTAQVYLANLQLEVKEKAGEGKSPAKANRRALTDLTAIMETLGLSDLEKTSVDAVRDEVQKINAEMVTAREEVLKHGDKATSRSEVEAEAAAALAGNVTQRGKDDSALKDLLKDVTRKHGSKLKKHGEEDPLVKALAQYMRVMNAALSGEDFKAAYTEAKRLYALVPAKS